MRERPSHSGDRTASEGWDAPDEFGVPANMLGRHPEEVFAGVGRIVTLSSLLEDRQRVLLQALTGVRPEGVCCTDR
jgi:hypothetical protein